MNRYLVTDSMGDAHSIHATFYSTRDDGSVDFIKIERDEFGTAIHTTVATFGKGWVLILLADEVN